MIATTIPHLACVVGASVVEGTQSSGDSIETAAEVGLDTGPSGDGVLGGTAKELRSLCGCDGIRAAAKLCVFTSTNWQQVV